MDTIQVIALGVIVLTVYGIDYLLGRLHGKPEKQTQPTTVKEIMDYAVY